MNNNIKSFIFFTLGIAVGSVGTWKYFEKKYQQLAQDEIDSVTQVFSKRIQPPENPEVRIKTKDKPNILDYVATNVKGFVDYSGISSNNTEEEVTDVELLTDEVETANEPYVIAPEDFGNMDDYDTVSLIYYADHVLADDDDREIEDVDEIIGLDSLETFGEYEDDSVFVRNDILKCDYEILLDPRNYSDLVAITPVITERKPHEVDD